MIYNDNFIQSLKNKNLKALDYLVENYSDLCLKVSYNILNNRQLSEECTNDVLLKIWDNISSFKGDTTDFSKWLVVITKRQSIDILRKEKRHNNSLELKEDIAYNFEDKTFKEVNKKLEKEVLKSSLDVLDKKSKEMVINHYFKDESLDKISTNLGISKNAVSNRLLRVRKKLKHILFIGRN